MAKIGVVTVTFNSGNVLEEFMTSILSQTHQDLILYVVDNDSKDNTISVLDNYSSDKIRLIENKTNYGVAKGNNQGIETAVIDGCDYVLLLNNDTVFGENLISTLLKDLINNNADMISPKIMYFEPKNVIWCAGGKFTSTVLLRNKHYGEEQIDIGQFNKVIPCDYVPTCCVLVKKCLFELSSVGLMDEKYFVYFDDSDWMWRAKNKKVKLIYTPTVTLYHKVSSLTGGISQFTMRVFYRNRIYFIRKNLSGFAKITNLFLIVAITIIKLILNKLPRKYASEILYSLYNGFKLQVES